MTREILFRGFESTGIKRKWRFGSLVDVAMATGESDYRIVERLSDGIVYCPVYTASVGQFTGLTDKNGKKLFEKDIVKEFLKSGGVKYHDIYFENGCFLIDGFQLYEQGVKNMELVGNVFEHPELMEE